MDHLDDQLLKCNAPHRGRLAAALPLIIVIAIAVTFFALLPLHAPWWYLVDSDGPYLASAINLLLGNPTEMLDHPALSLQQLLSGCLAIDFFIHHWTTGITLHQYGEAALRDLNQKLPILRAAAFALFIFGAGVACEVTRRLFRRPGLAVAAGLLYMAVPGHLAFAMHYRPANALSGLCLLTVYLLIRGRQTHRASYHLAAAVCWGLAIGVKAHAIALAPLFLYAFAVRPIDDLASSLWSELTGFARVNAGKLVLLFTIFAALIVGSNINRAPAMLDWKLLAAVSVFLVYFAAGLWLRGTTRHRFPLNVVINPALALMCAAVILGMFGPSLAVLDELRPLAWQYARVFTGKTSEAAPTAAGILGGLGTYAQQLLDARLPLLVLLGLAALAIELHRRSWQVRYWGMAAAGMIALAVLRGSLKPSIHYLGPGLALLIPVIASVLYHESPRLLCDIPTRRRTTLRVATALALLVIVLNTTQATLQTKQDAVRRCRSLETLTLRYGGRLAPHEVLMTNYGALNEEASYFMMIREYCCFAPQPPQRSYADTPGSLREMDALGLHPAYYLIGGPGSPEVELVTGSEVTIYSAWGSTWRAQQVESICESKIRYTVYRILERLPASDPQIARSG